MNSQRASALINKLAADHSQPPTTELNYGSKFELLVAVILSAQATDRSVNRVTATLFPITPQSLLEMGEKKFLHHIKQIGLAPTKARHIIKTCLLLLEKHRGSVPESHQDLEALPGVGRKTANVVRAVAFGHPTIAVDTHVFRVSNRTGLAPGRTPLEVEKKLLAIVPKKHLPHAHHYFILHGRYVCKARKPLCKECIILKECQYPHKNQPA